MKTDRPVNLRLFPQPLAALVSITHRITGVMLFVGVAFGLYALELGLSSAQGFAEAQALIKEPLPAFIMLGLIFVLVFHVVAGIKHLLLDMHIGDSLQAAQTNAVVIIVVSVVATIGLGVALW